MLMTLDNTQALHRQIYEKLRHKVLSDELKPGQKLPATRELARDLGVSRTTVLQAYDQLIAEGYLHTRAGSGTYVSVLLEKTNQPTSRPKRQPLNIRLSHAGKLISKQLGSMFAASPANGHVPFRYDFRMGNVRMDEHSRQVWRRLVNTGIRDLTATSREPQGYYPLRQAIAEHLQRVRNCRCSAENVVITNGSQQTFDLLARLLLNPGDIAAIEDPHYFGARLAFSFCQAKLVYAKVDEEGIRIDQLAKHAANAKLVYVTPSHQFPTGGLMSLPRRLALIEWARVNKAIIVEDDYDSEFRYNGRPMEAIQAIDPYGQTIYVGTFSKVLSPALRLGYAVLPEPLVAPFVAMRWVSDVQSPLMQQHALARWMSEGYHHRHLRRMRRIYSERHEILLHSLKKYFPKDGIVIEGGGTGLHILVWLNGVPAICTDKLSEGLQKNSIAAYSAGSFYKTPPLQCGFGLGFGLIDSADIEQGIQLFQRTVSEHGHP